MLNPKLLITGNYKMLNNNVAAFNLGKITRLCSEISGSIVDVEPNTIIKIVDSNIIITISSAKLEYTNKIRAHSETRVYDNKLNLIVQGETLVEIKDGLYELDGILYDRDFKRVEWAKDLEVKEIIQRGELLLFKKQVNSKDETLLLYDTNGDRCNPKLYRIHNNSKLNVTIIRLPCGVKSIFSVVTVDYASCSMIAMVYAGFKGRLTNSMINEMKSVLGEKIKFFDLNARNGESELLEFLEK